jgi:polyhydroxybutyrate depolymerase
MPISAWFRRGSAVLAAAVVVSGAAACGPRAGAAQPGPAVSPGAAIPVGRSTQTISVGGVGRTFHLYRPAGISAAAPLVVLLHGGYGSGTQAEDSYHWDPVADEGHFVAVFPDGTNASWNAGGGCCGEAARGNVDDVAFLSQMVTTVEKETAIDPDRVFVSGVSNGGVMAYRMACQTSLFAAVGVDSTTMLADCSQPAPASVLHIHGTADPIIRYDGGRGAPFSLNGSTIDGPSVPSVNATWRAIDHCAAPQSTTSGVVTTSVAQCPDGRAVELITIAGAGHQWPGGDPNPRAERLFHTGTPSTALNATAVIWQFFAAHPR